MENKTKEQLAEEYAKDKSSADVFKQGHIKDFIAGWDARLEIEALTPKWVSVEDGVPKLKTFYKGNTLMMDASIDCICYDGESKFYDTFNSDDGFHESITHYIIINELPNPPKIK